MNCRYILLLLVMCFSGEIFAAPVEFSKIYIPEFRTNVHMMSRDFKVESGYLELRSEFIKCVVACKYTSKTKKIPLSVKPIGRQVIEVNFDRNKSKRITETGARLSECGVNIVLKGKIDGKSYLTKARIYKVYSDFKKNNCNDKAHIEAMVESRFSENIVFSNLIGPL